MGHANRTILCTLLCTSFYKLRGESKLFSVVISKMQHKLNLNSYWAWNVLLLLLLCTHISIRGLRDWSVIILQRCTAASPVYVWVLSLHAVTSPPRLTKPEPAPPPWRPITSKNSLRQRGIRREVREFLGDLDTDCVCVKGLEMKWLGKCAYQQRNVSLS